MVLSNLTLWMGGTKKAAEALRLRQVGFLWLVIGVVVGRVSACVLNAVRRYKKQELR